MTVKTSKDRVIIDTNNELTKYKGRIRFFKFYGLKCALDLWIPTPQFSRGRDTQ